jgi:hypothetical protein
MIRQSLDIQRTGCIRAIQNKTVKYSPKQETDTILSNNQVRAIQQLGRAFITERHVQEDSTSGINVYMYQAIDCTLNFLPTSLTN